MIAIKAYAPGTYVTISGIFTASGIQHKDWEILSTRIELVESDNPLRTAEITQICTILAIDVNGDNLGEEAIQINTDMYDIVEH